MAFSAGDGGEAQVVAMLTADHAERARLGSAARALAADLWQRRAQRIVEVVRETAKETGSA